MKLKILTALLVAGIASAEHSMLAPLGFNKIVCLTNSDTIVGVPFRMQGSMRNQLASAPIADPGDPDLFEIPLQSLNLTPGALDRHYLKFEGGAREGRWYDITANSATSVTIDLNGDTLDGVTQGDPVILTEYWTLDTLFPPDQATTSWTEHPANPGEWIQNGHAIVASAGTRAFERRTEVLLPNIDGEGINRSSTGFYFIHQAQWKKVNEQGTEFGSTILPPDSIFTIRNPSSVSHGTVFRISGSVDLSNFTIPLHTSTNSQRDAFIGLPRPVDVTLKELNLWESGAFIQSIGTRAFQRRDELLVYDNAQSSLPKSVVAFYFHDGTNWLAVNDDDKLNRDDDVIPAGSGFIIRKYQTGTGETVFWNNQPSY